MSGRRGLHTSANQMVGLLTYTSRSMTLSGRECTAASPTLAFPQSPAPTTHKSISEAYRALLSILCKKHSCMMSSCISPEPSSFFSHRHSSTRHYCVPTTRTISHMLLLFLSFLPDPRHPPLRDNRWSTRPSFMLATCSSLRHLLSSYLPTAQLADMFARMFAGQESRPPPNLT
ncbi:unnamed protein product [Protopolystoma xenopodis]|uniref:Uncharacterized protein n=1 Tax=Protopolystoma xenopodis TaxID=117903 RepID=A0A448WTN5_9PLAT|nr:unnamed protein product [Protopolystoma xenopodis]